MPRLIVFSTGTKTGGGSGLRELIRSTKTGVLQAEIVLVVSNHAEGGVSEISRQYGVPFVHFNGPFVAEEYQSIIATHNGEWYACMRARDRQPQP